MKKSMYKKMLMGMMGFAVLLKSGPVWAQEEDAEDFQEYTLGEVVVKGDKSSVRDLAITTEITPLDFEITNSDSVSEVLAFTPGVTVSTGAKNLPQASIHGFFDQKRVLTLIDGIPYYETKYGYLDLNQIALESVARIDVVKGAPSVLYGVNALGGVINIISKKPTEKPFFGANVEYGLDGYDSGLKVAASHGKKVGDFNYWLSYSHREWDAWELSKDYEVREGYIRYRGYPLGSRPAILEDGGDRNNSDYKSDNIWAKFGFEPSEDSQAYANLHYIMTTKGYPPDVDFIMVFDDFSRLARIEDYNDWGIDLSGKHHFTDKFGIQGTLFYHNHEDNYHSYDDETYSNNYARSDYKDYILGGSILGDVKLADWDTIKFSLNYRGDSHEQRAFDYVPHTESFGYTGSLGLENEATFLDYRLSVIAGAGYDWYEVDKMQDDPDNDGNIIECDTPNTMSEFNPMVGVNYMANDATNLFLSVARKTRFPTLNEISKGDEPNLALEAETSINYTAGISWKSNSTLSLEFSPFYHDISDYITREAPDNPNDQYINYEKVKVLGFELSMILTPVSNLMVTAAYTYNDAENKSAQRATDKVVYVPEYTFNLAAQYIIPDLGTTLNLSMRHVGEAYDELPTLEDPDDPEVKSEKYTFFNAKIAQPFLNNWEGYLSCNNLFDKDYEPQVAYPSPGRQIWLGVTYKY